MSYHQRPGGRRVRQWPDLLAHGTNVEDGKIWRWESAGADNFELMARSIQ